MLSTKVIDKLNEIRSLLNTERYQYLQKLFDLTGSDEGFYNRVDAYDWVNSPNQDDLTRFTNSSAQLAAIPIRGLFSDLEALDKLLKSDTRILEFLPISITGKAEDYIGDLTKALEYQLSRKTDRFLIFLLLDKASRLFTMLKDIEMFSKLIIERLEENEFIHHEEDSKSLSIFLDSQVTFDKFILKLDAINSIYSELAQLMDISLTEKPIQIQKIESGSVLQDILGYPRIIEFITKLLEDGIDYLYRNFTKEGKITSIPRNVEAIESILQIRKQLRAAGIDTDELDESINKSSVVIAQKLNDLLLGEPRVKINKKEYYIGDEFADRYLTESNTYLLRGDSEIIE